MRAGIFFEEEFHLEKIANNILEKFLKMNLLGLGPHKLFALAIHTIQTDKFMKIIQY